MFNYSTVPGSTSCYVVKLIPKGLSKTHHLASIQQSTQKTLSKNEGDNNAENVRIQNFGFCGDSTMCKARERL